MYYSFYLFINFFNIQLVVVRYYVVHLKMTQLTFPINVVCFVTLVVYHVRIYRIYPMHKS